MRLANMAGAAYFLLMLLLPFILMPEKVLLAVMWLGLRWVGGQVFVSPARAYAAATIFCYALFQVLYILYGQLMGAPHESLLFTVPIYAAYPIFAGISCFVATERDIEFIARVSRVLAPWICCYLAAYFLGEIGISPVKLPSVYDKSTVQYTAGEAGIGHPLVSVLLWCGPCYVLAVLGREYSGLLSRVGAVLGAIGTAIVVVLSSRRSIVLTTGVSIAAFLIICAACGLGKIARRVVMRLATFAAIGILAVVLVASALDIDLAAYANSLLAPATSRSLASQSDVLRQQQELALTRSLQGRLAFGNGIGSYTNAVVRSESKPWRYEMGFYAALFRYGVAGTLVYLTLVIVILANGLMLVTEPRSVAQSQTPFILTAAVIGQLAGYLVNPILDSLDTAWEFFLPALLLAALSRRGLLASQSVQGALHGG